MCISDSIQTLLEERFSVKDHFDEIKTIYKERPIQKVNKIIQIEVPPNPYWATICLLYTSLKANVAEIAATYQAAYPNARILYASEKDLSLIHI